MPLRHALFTAACLIGAASAASAEEPIVRVSATAKAACMPDAMRYCRDAVPNIQNVLICFGVNRDKISSRCRIVLASYGLQ